MSTRPILSKSYIWTRGAREGRVSPEHVGDNLPGYLLALNTADALLSMDITPEVVVLRRRENVTHVTIKRARGA